jgi:cyanate permease
MSLGIGFAIGPWLAGYLHDVSGTYRVAFVIAILATSFACIWFWMAAPRKVRLVGGKSKGSERRRAA